MRRFCHYIALRGVAPNGYVGFDAGVLAWNDKVTVSDSGSRISPRNRSWLPVLGSP
jgi:hypothetical protein